MLPIINSSYFQDLLESFPYGVIIFNIDGEAYAVNSLALKIWGLNSDECLNKDWRYFFTCFSCQQELQKMFALAQKGKQSPKSVESKYARSDGHVYHLSLSISLLMENKKVFGIVLSLADVSHIFNLHEREKRILEDKRSLEKQRAQSMELLSMSIAHQVRNPLMSIGGFSRLICAKAKGQADICEYATAIMEACKRLEALVAAVSNYSNFKVKQICKIDLKPILCEILQDKFGDVILAEDNFELILSESFLYSDADLIRTVLEAVIINIFEAVEDPYILIICKIQDKRFEIIIEDNGPGIDSQNLGYIFDPFYTTKPYNIGMGLTISRRIVQELGGDISLQNKEQGGLRVNIFLPLQSE